LFSKIAFRFQNKFTLWQVLFETRTIVIGWFPAFTCRKGVGEGYINRLAWTWVAFAYGSLGLYFFFLYTYQLIGQTGPSSSFFPFYYVTLHLLNRRSITWMLLLLVPIAAALCDVTGKVFGNMYFPTQTQIHMEIASEDNARSKKKKGDTKEKAN